MAPLPRESTMLRGVARPGDFMRRLAATDDEGSFSNARRARRFEPFARIVERRLQQQGSPVRILDIGGTNSFWEQRGWAGRQDVSILLVNIEADEHLHDNIESMSGDATDLHELPDQSFDIVFSNSVIEHLATHERQASMASEVRRLAPVYWVQTPNFWFPVEPHFLTPGWHWLPVRVRVELLRRRRWGWRGPCPDKHEAEALVREVRLMRAPEVRRLFPEATLRVERIGPLSKSLVAVCA